MSCRRGYLLEQRANSLHMVQLMPLPPHYVFFSKIQNGLSWYRLTWVVPDKGSYNSCSSSSSTFVFILLWLLYYYYYNILLPFVRDYQSELIPEGKTILDFTQAEMTGWQWHQPDHMQVICTSFQTDNLASTSSLCFYGLDALPDTKPAVSKH